MRILASVALATLLGFARPADAAGPPSIESTIRLQGASGRDAAVIIGNEAYAALPQATYAGPDARSVQSMLVNGMGLSKSRLVFVENATSAQIADSVKKATTKLKKGGTLWIYYAGYGTVADGQRALLGVDAMPDALDKSAVPLDSLLAMTARTKAARVIVIVDAGFGGVGRDDLPLLANNKTIEAPKGPPTVADNTMVWLADAGGRTVGGYGDGRHGLFTWLTLGALRGWADGAIPGSEKDGKVTVEEAQYYVSWTGRRLGRPMTPSEEQRPTVQGWVLAQGSLEKGPTDTLLSELAAADRLRRVTYAEERVRGEASAFWQQTAALANSGGPEGKQALQAFIDAYSMPVVTVEMALYIPEVIDAQLALKNYGAAPAASEKPADAEKPKDPKDTRATEDKPPPSEKPAPVVSVASCDDLVALEGVALLGQFTNEQITCLQGKLATARLQTNKNKISRMLLVNAQTKGDIGQWETLMRRHLEEIDRSDPALCMLYAVHLHKKGVEYDDEAIYWSAYALENKQVWVGDEYVKRVNGLYRLRAEAAGRLWTTAEKTYQKDPTDDNDAATREYRGLAKDFAREWLDYARASGQDVKTALELCRSAAGSDAFCQGK